MSEFKVKVDNVRGIIQDQKDIARQIRELEGEIRQVEYGLSFEIAQKERIRQRLRNARETITSQYQGIYNAAKILNQIADTYEATEVKLAGKEINSSKFGSITNISDIIDTIITNLPEVSPFIFPSAFLPLILPGMLISMWNISPYQKSETEFNLGMSYSDSLDLKKEKSWYSKNESELKDSEIDKFKVIEAKWKETRSLFHSEDIIGDEEGTHIKSKLDLFKQEICGEVYGSLYVTDSKTGERKLRPGIGANFGYTLSGISAEQEAQLGNEYLSAYMKTEETLGKVEVKGDIAAGLWDGDGKFNPTIHGKLAAEAILVEASAKAGVKVLGADVGVEGAVNFGVGAHAEVGYKDGKISADIGASMGVGASIKFEVDISGVVDALTGLTKAVWNWK